jgi:hypothetical protein
MSDGSGRKIKEVMHAANGGQSNYDEVKDQYPGRFP